MAEGFESPRVFYNIAREWRVKLSAREDETSTERFLFISITSKSSDHFSNSTKTEIYLKS